MRKIRKRWRGVALVTSVVMTLFAMVPRVQAGYSASQPLQSVTGTDSAELQSVKSALESKAVSSRLHDLGYSDAEVAVRLERMGPDQISMLAGAADDMQVGGSVLGVAIAAVIFVLLVVLLLELVDDDEIVID